VKYGLLPKNSNRIEAYKEVVEVHTYIGYYDQMIQFFQMYKLAAVGDIYSMPFL
jgi:hypothetical protein